MPFPVVRRWTAASEILEYGQYEDDGAVQGANSVGLFFGTGVIQANGRIGDGPYGSTSGDFDAFVFAGHVGQTITIDVDAQFLGSTLDAQIDFYKLDFGATLYTLVDADPTGGVDPFLRYTPTEDGTYVAVIRGAGSTQINPFSSSLGTGAGSIGDYRVFIDNGGGNILHGTNDFDILTGTSNPDVIVGNGSTDTLNGGGSNDLFIWKPGDGNDSVVGGSAFDTQELNGSNNSETVTLSGANPLGDYSTIDIVGIAGGDALIFFSELESLDFRARGGDDVLRVADLSLRSLTGLIQFRGGTGKDTLAAGAAINPFLASGEAGNDVLRSGSGADTLNGGPGNDVLAGGRGRDVLIGGTGRDYFDFNAANESAVAQAGRDVINGFSRAQQDRIDLRTIDADQRAANPGNDVFIFIGAQSFAAYHAANPGVFGMVRFAGGVVQGSVDADMAAEFSIKVAGLGSMIGSDFFL